MIYQSIILRFAIYIYKCIEDFVENTVKQSLIITFLKRLVSFVIRKWKQLADNSIFITSIKKVFHTFVKYTTHSSIWRFIYKEGYLTRIWADSAVYKILDFIFTKPLQTLRKLFLKTENYFISSTFYILLRLVLQNLYLWVAAFFVILFVVPDAKWNNRYILLVGLAFFVLFLIKTIIFDKVMFRINSLEFFTVAYGLTVFLAYILSLFRSESLRFLMFYLSCFLFLLIITNTIRTRRQLLLFIEIILVGVTITGLYGIYQGIKGVPVDPSLVDIKLNDGSPGRVYSTMANANNYAEILVMMLPFYMAVILSAKTVFKRLIYIAMALVSFVALFLTLSRSGWIGLAVAVIVFVFFWNKKLLPWMLVLGVISIPFLPQSIYRRILTIFNPNDSSMNYRGNIYKSALSVLKDFWITGIGLGTDAFKSISQNYYQYTGRVDPHSHNLYLQIWLETGILGIIAFFAFIARTIKSSIKNIYSKCDQSIKFVLMAGVSSLVGVMVIGLVEYIWYYVRVMQVFWLVLSIMITAVGLRRNSPEIQ